MRKHGVAVFGQTRVTTKHVTQNTCCKHKPTRASKHDNTKQQASMHPRTQEDMELQLHHHFATHIDPSCSLHQATNHILYWIGTATTMVPKNKTQKCGNTGSSCLDKPMLGKGCVQGGWTTSKETCRHTQGQDFAPWVVVMGMAMSMHRSTGMGSGLAVAATRQGPLLLEHFPCYQYTHQPVSLPERSLPSAAHWTFWNCQK
jgi:hypothetical protein